MRKLFIMATAAVMVLVFTVPAFSLENIFGGYWRTRVYNQTDFSGLDDGAQDLQRVDTRTRLYYTAKFSDNFKFVNKFEMDAVWGDDSSYGDIGADSVSVEVKNSYVDFTFDPVNFKIGVQGVTLNRGFLFDDDFSGALVTYNVSKDIAVPFFWVKAYEGGIGDNRNDLDVDYYGINPSIKAGNATIAPIFVWAHSKDASEWITGFEETDVYYVGADVDLAAGPASIWFTGLYQFGSADLVGGGDVDISSYLLAVGASTDVNNINLHGQIFYASGDDDADDDAEAFFVPGGQSYYWSEIMGYGIFDNQVSAGSPADQISNILAANVGVTVKPLPKLSVSADLWYAQLAEDNANGDKDLGTEIDLTANYKLLDNLNLDLVAAYLFAGDATTTGAVKNDENPMEFGAQLSLSF
jgi:hypothetical protein